MKRLPRRLARVGIGLLLLDLCVSGIIFLAVAIHELTS